MEKWDKQQRKLNHRENPSFSSTLLDVIYRSIDEGTQPKDKEEKLIFFRETMSKKNIEDVIGEAEKVNIHRGRRLENCLGRNSLTEFERRTRNNSNTLSMYSSSSSSESSSIGGFSSSESESFYGVQKPKPIRTSVSCQKTNFDETQNPKLHENNGFGKTKSKALRILYGDLKKSKQQQQPISPGAKLASFLNSLFTSSGNSKKPKVSSSKMSNTSMHEGSISATQKQGSSYSSASTCSSVSSFSRSCLSKTPSSRSGAKRSVRFCPVSVIVDEDCRPIGHKNLHENEEAMKVKTYEKINNKSEELRFHVMQESHRVEELARELLKNYQKKNEDNFDTMQCNDDDDDDDDDDACSCASSDLFELDNLSEIGIQRYRKELPVYETTHFNTNRAIANGFIV
ncbi:hypothetical protein Lal_00033395 [Lupinus albus]|uniref:Uncharacterized protein n=1 Tax=Lupinus albus TaxID=3870 RepID=A0A6A5M5D8_LUPAL|nr:hypothetical protein Lalb_Chr25g0281171 [Lupinus albus]KAF1865932.1 hypothetical protein Lal_00033395 [Lupinus albus]